jgi:hypothetical protein
MKVPSTLLHHYFNTASKLQVLIDSPLPDETPTLLMGQ